MLSVHASCCLERQEDAGHTRGSQLTDRPMAVVYPDNLAALGVCRALGARGVPVTVLSSDRTAPGQYSRYARREPCPAGDERELVDFLVAFGRAQRQAPVLFLTDDPSIVALHRHRPLLEAWYRFPLAPWPVLRRIMLKDELYRSLEGVVPLPRTRILTEESELASAGGEIGYPALVKPLLRCLSDSHDAGRLPFEKLFGFKAVRVRSLEELTAAYHAARAHGFSLVLQEEIDGPVSSLRSLGLYATRDGDVAATFTSRKLCQVPSDFGDGLIVQAARVPELIPLSVRVVNHFGYYGLADIEFKWDARDRAYKLLDFNPRPWLWINLPTACGVNLPYAAYLDALGERLDREAFIQRDFQTRWVSFRGLLVYLVRWLKEGRHSGELRPLLRDYFGGRRVGPLFDTADVLTRMFLSPRYWWESLRQAAANIQRLQLHRQER